MDNTLALKRRAVEKIEEMRDRLFEISAKIFANPEVGYEEHKASGWLADFLEANGYEVERGVCGMPTAFVAARSGGRGGPAVGLLAEYDALPNLGHACAHNIIGTASAGAAVALGSLLGETGGSVKVYGCPAEERVGEGGKVPMVEGGLFNGLEVAMMMHPYNQTTRDHGLGGLAATQVTLEFKGKEAHGAAPYPGRSALDAVIFTFQNVNALRQFVPEDGRIHGVITDGGKVPNVIPARSEAKFMVRAARTETMEEMVERLLECARAGAMASRTELRVSRGFTYRERRINRALAEAFEANLVELGVRLDTPSPKRGGSTDGGNVSHVVPLILSYVKMVDLPVVNHTPGFAEAAGSEPGRRVLLMGAKALAMTAIDVLTRPELREKIRSEFAAR